MDREASHPSSSLRALSASSTGERTHSTRSISNSGAGGVAMPPSATEWKKDGEATECSQCAKAFSTLRRRHHCRGCGDIFCGACTRRKVPLPHLTGRDKPVRSCAACAAPTIKRLSRVPTSGGEIIMDVENLRCTAAEMTIEVEGEPCGGVRILPSGRVRCSAPAGLGRDRRLFLRTADDLSCSALFSYAAPEIQHCTRAPTGGVW